MRTSARATDVVQISYPPRTSWLAGCAASCFGVEPLDLPRFVAVAALVVLIANRRERGPRASRVDPNVLLRS
jgi:hypothetical protein